MENPLSQCELEGAAYLCLAKAALTDLDQFPPGSGWQSCRELHGRRRRFEEAAAKLRAGSSSLPELGILPEDCAWAVSMAKRAKDPDQWLLNFKTAESSLRVASKT